MINGRKLTIAKIKFHVSNRPRRKYFLFGKKVFVGKVFFTYNEVPFVQEEWKFYGDTMQECSDNGFTLASEKCKRMGFNWDFLAVQFGVQEQLKNGNSSFNMKVEIDE